MLKVTILESATEQIFVVDGKLTATWVSEVELARESTRRARCGRRCVVHLNDATSTGAETDFSWRCAASEFDSSPRVTLAVCSQKQGIEMLKG
jgi:hypothetical protein